ncbi:PepSY domain-containing protein [Nocardioides nanhaiensis]|uniref:PepSY domain-containing protein n=1 Tax=Nocardioides nanhaiensis TaxID=1476871 RepID=A0ABP8VXT2_9ACTN
MKNPLARLRTRTRDLPRKRVVVPALAVVAVLGAGGVAVAATAGPDDLQGTDRDRAASAALEFAGGGTVTDAETSDDRGTAYEVDVTREDGTEVEVHLDDAYQVVRSDEDRDGRDDDDRDDDDRDDSDDRDDDDSDDRGGDDRAVTAEQREQAETAALAEVPGTVTEVEAEDDGATSGEVYEVHVLTAEGQEWHVGLAEDFTVVEKHLDD